MSKKLTIGESCNIATGKLDSNQAVANGKYPFFTCAADPIFIDNYSFDDDVVLVAGNNAQGNFHVNRFNGKFNAYQRTYILTKKGNYNIDYIYYSLKLELKRLKEKAQGSQTKFLTMPILTSILLKELNTDNQKKIAAVLSALDAKIELNNRINAELENLAKTIYDYWFVQFDFPNADGKPYKSSGGEMVYVGEGKGDRAIPAGWEVTKLGKILKTTLGGTPSTKEPNYWLNGDIPWLNSGEISNFPIISSEKCITQAGIDSSAASLTPKGSVVVSIVRYIRPSILAIDACANQSVLGIYESEKLLNSFIYPYLVSQVPRLMSLRTGAQQPHINKETIDTSLIVIPQNDVLSSYYKIANPLFKEIINIAFQNQQLTQLRDWLLPMLMNGQISIK